jgi:hypothetical protein
VELFAVHQGVLGLVLQVSGGAGNLVGHVDGAVDELNVECVCADDHLVGSAVRAVLQGPLPNDPFLVHGDHLLGSDGHVHGHDHCDYDDLDDYDDHDGYDDCDGYDGHYDLELDDVGCDGILPSLSPFHGGCDGQSNVSCLLSYS